MCSAASRSSSPVVTPATVASDSSASVRPTTSPAARIRSIWSGVLISTPRSRNTERSALVDVRHGVEDPLGDLVHVADPVDLAEQAPAAVDLDERLGLLGVDLLAPPDDVLRVVAAPLGLRARGEPADQLVGVDGEDDDGVEAVTGEPDHPVELLDLVEGARVAVEQEALDGVLLVDPVADHLVRDVVGDVLARVHEALGLDTELGALRDVGAEDVAGRDRGDPEPVGDDLRLGALA